MFRDGFPGNASLLIGAVHPAKQEIGAPGIAESASFQLPYYA